MQVWLNLRNKNKFVNKQASDNETTQLKDVRQENNCYCKNLLIYSKYVYDLNIFCQVDLQTFIFGLPKIIKKRFKWVSQLIAHNSSLVCSLMYHTEQLNALKWLHRPKTTIVIGSHALSFWISLDSLFMWPKYI